jgi:ribonuclease Y
MMNIGLAIGLIVVALVIGLAGGYSACILLQSKATKKNQLVASELAKKAMTDAATAKKEALLEAKEEAHKLRVECDNEIRERRTEIQRLEARILTREEQLGKREENVTNHELAVEAAKTQAENTKKQCEENLKNAKEKHNEAVAKLEQLSGLTKAEAKKLIIDKLTEEAKADAVEKIRQIEEDAKADADKKAREIITAAVQRVSTDASDEITVSTVSIANDEVKGRLIGREGRNIRSIEAVTGVDLIIDDTPEVITVSSFDPYRREIAKLTIEKLIMDGRINPAHIEEICERVTKDLEVTCKDTGEHAAYDARVVGLSPEILKTLGRLKYRYSYGQNVLKHSVEVSIIAGLLAVELGANEVIARRGGLLHDIGKATDHEVDGTHVSIGVDIARRNKEKPEVIHCIEAHHGDVPYNSIEAIIVQVADAISSSRPGARRESMENYIQRLHDLEDICKTKSGVDKCYAISAGREVRVIVKPDQISDADAVFLAKDLAKEIEEKLQYPGQIKVNVIRETRATELAK